ncbi:MAG: DUF1107 domain-containing protein [Aeromonas sp.]
MREFKLYLPRLVAKHVKTFFKGELYIHGRGHFSFQAGQLVLPRYAPALHKATVNEINALISRLHLVA